MLERLIWAVSSFIVGLSLALSLIGNPPRAYWKHDPRLGIVMTMYDSVQYENKVLRLAVEYGAPSFEVAKLVYDASVSRRISPELAFSLIRVESAWKEEIVSYAGAVGLTQVMPATGMETCGAARDDLFVAAINVPCGLDYLGQMLDRFDGDTVRALLAYNAGPSKARRPDYWNPYPDKVLGGIAND